MKPHSVNNLNNFIGGFYIDPQICDDIVIKGEKKPDVFSIGIKEYRDRDLIDFDKKLFERYIEELFTAVEAYKQLYPLCYQELQRWTLSHPRIQRYDPGKYYSQPHCENNGGSPYLTRHLAYMTYLNDIEEGGGTEFINQKIITNAEKGLTLLWPAGWTHYHAGVVAPKETKYIITGWCIFTPDHRSRF